MDMKKYKFVKWDMSAENKALEEKLKKLESQQATKKRNIELKKKLREVQQTQKKSKSFIEKNKGTIKGLKGVGEAALDTFDYVFFPKIYKKRKSKAKKTQKKKSTSKKKPKKVVKYYY